jgi:hypothetical protein
MKLPSLHVLDSEYTIHKYAPDQSIPIQLLNTDIYWIGKTDEELSIVCESSIDLQSDEKNAGWSCIKIQGPLELSTIGVLARITEALATANISVLALSTFDTDYILVKDNLLSKSINTLKLAGYKII